MPWLWPAWPHGGYPTWCVTDTQRANCPEGGDGGNRSWNHGSAQNNSWNGNNDSGWGDNTASNDNSGWGGGNDASGASGWGDNAQPAPQDDSRQAQPRASDDDDWGTPAPSYDAPPPRQPHANNDQGNRAPAAPFNSGWGGETAAPREERGRSNDAWNSDTPPSEPRPSAPPSEAPRGVHMNPDRARMIEQETRQSRPVRQPEPPRFNDHFGGGGGPADSGWSNRRFNIESPSSLGQGASTRPPQGTREGWSRREEAPSDRGLNGGYSQTGGYDSGGGYKNNTDGPAAGPSGGHSDTNRGYSGYYDNDAGYNAGFSSNDNANNRASVPAPPPASAVSFRTWD